MTAQQGEWTAAVFGGVMTSNAFEEVFQPNKINFVDSQIAGVILGYELRLPDDRWTLGAEVQVAKHFGLQHHTEINLPVVLRYHPKKPWPRPLESVAFGIGGSHATALPQVEIDNDGATRRNQIYWLFEVEFATPQPRDTMFLRLHHPIGRIECGRFRAASVILTRHVRGGQRPCNRSRSLSHSAACAR